MEPRDRPLERHGQAHSARRCSSTDTQGTGCIPVYCMHVLFKWAGNTSVHWSSSKMDRLFERWTRLMEENWEEWQDELQVNNIGL